MEERKKQRNSAAYSAPFTVQADDNTLIEGKVYNVFPEIAEPLHRAYYLPLVDGIYLPITASADADPAQFEEALDQGLESVLWHEIAHAVVADTIITCKQRELAFRLLARSLSLIAEGEEGYQLLVPSFVVVRPDGTKDYELAEIANELDGLLGATNLIHEITAGALQAELLGLDTPEAKEHIRLSVGDVAAKAFVTDTLLDDVLAIMEHITAMGLALVVSGLLNSSDIVGLSEEGVVERFQRMARLAANYVQRPDFSSNLPATDNGDVKPIEVYFRLMEVYEDLLNYLNHELPGCKLGVCPLASASGRLTKCLSKNLRKEAKRVQKGSLAGSVLLMGARLMDRVRCAYPTQEIIPAQSSANVKVEELHQPDPEVVALLSPATDNVEAAWPTMYLSLHQAGQGLHTVGFAAVNQKQPGKALENALHTSLLFEAVWQQLWTGDGPRCLCHPNQQPNCLLSMMIARLWERTEADPGWASNWKLHEPTCAK